MDGVVTHALNAAKAFSKLGVRGSFYHFFKFRTFKFGTLVGVDKFGNHYYENTEDYEHGRHRWVDYAGDRSYYDVEASEVCPEWHAWLHQVTDDPPTEVTVGSVYKVAPQTGMSHSDAPYARNIGGVLADWTVNQTQRRPRGFNQGNGMGGPLGSGPNETGYYTQPGNVLDPRHHHAKRQEMFDLRDTPETLRSKSERSLPSGDLAAIAEAKLRMLASAEDGVATFGREEQEGLDDFHPEVDCDENRRKLLRESELVLAIGAAGATIRKYGNIPHHHDAKRAVEKAEDSLVELYEELEEIRALKEELGYPKFI